MESSSGDKEKKSTVVHSTQLFVRLVAEDGISKSDI
jgi:hypothetical protein